jgi:hypothetical protein
LSTDYLKTAFTHFLSSSYFPFYQVYGVEGRYASALYSAASKQKSLDAVEKDLKTFGEALKKDDR